MLKVGVVGATGYAGEEVIKILIGHKNVKITELSAVIEKEEPISSIFPAFKGKIDLVCHKPDAEKMAKMGRKARLVYEEKYTAEQNYKQMIEIYRSIIT